MPRFQGCPFRLFFLALFPISFRQDITQFQSTSIENRYSHCIVEKSLCILPADLGSSLFIMLISFKTSFIHCIHITAFTSLAAAAVTNWRVGQIVQTTSGLVKGHAAGDANEVSEYLGIPYAQPPVGDLRFQPPVAYNSTSTILATDFGNACMQPDLGLSATGKRQILGLHLTAAGLALLTDYAKSIPNRDEDCLTLNVWTKPQTGDDKKAVLASSTISLTAEMGTRLIPKRCGFTVVAGRLVRLAFHGTMASISQTKRMSS